MSNPFVGELRLVAFNFNPTGWALAAGQLMPISQNTALFSLLGTQYGGDGKSTFALPNLQGNLAIGQGQGPGLSDYFMGEESGVAAVTLLQSEIPLHNHGVMASTDNQQNTPVNNAIGQGAQMFDSGSTPTTPLAFQMCGVTGSSLPHNNMMPYLGLNWIIALQGVFPARS